MSVNYVDRLYWLLVLKGPMTLPEIQQETNWTPKRSADMVYRLKRQGCIELVERRRHGIRWHRCGKWRAIQDSAAALGWMRPSRRQSA